MLNKSSSPQQNHQTQQYKKSWDSRLNVNSYIPQYNPILDKHTKSYKNVINKIQLNRDKKESSLNKQQKLFDIQKDNELHNDWQQKKQILIRQRMAPNALKTNQKTKQLLIKVQGAWSTSQIETFYSYYFLKYLKGLTAQLANSFILQQIRVVYSKESNYFLIDEAIKARQNCLYKMRNLLDRLSQLRKVNKLKIQKKQEEYQVLNKAGQQQQKKKSLYQAKQVQFFQQIKNLRKLTLLFINRVKFWRQQLKNMNIKGDHRIHSYQIPIYYYNKQNYMLKILTDYNFLNDYFLSDYLQFTPNDPFLLKVINQPLQSSKAFRQNSSQRQQYLFLLQQSGQNIQLYQKALQVVAQQKANQLRSKINVQDIQLKRKRVASTGRIQRIYKNKQINQVLKRNKGNTHKNIQGTLGQINQIPDQKEVQRLRQIRRHEQKLQSIKKIYKQKSRPIKAFDLGDIEQIIQSKKKASNNLLNRKQQKKVQHKPKQKINKNNYSDFQNMVRKKQLQVLNQVKKVQPKHTIGRSLQHNNNHQQLQQIINLYKNQDQSLIKKSKQQLAIVPKRQRSSNKTGSKKKLNVSKRIFQLQNKLFDDQQQKNINKYKDKKYEKTQAPPISKYHNLKGFQSDTGQQKYKYQNRYQNKKKKQQSKRGFISQDQQVLKNQLKDKIKMSLMQELKERQAVQQRLLKEQHLKYQNLKKSLKQELQRQMKIQRARRQVQKMQIQKRVRQQEARLQAQRNRLDQLLRQKQRNQKFRFERQLQQNEKKMKHMLQQQQNQLNQAQQRRKQQIRKRNNLEKQIHQNKLRQDIQRQMRKDLQQQTLVEQIQLKKRIQRQSQQKRLSLQRQIQQIRKQKQRQIDSMMVQTQVKQQMVYQMRQKQQKKRAALQKQLFQQQYHQRALLQNKSKIKKQQLQNVIFRNEVRVPTHQIKQQPIIEQHRSRIQLFNKIANQETKNTRNQPFKKQIIQSHLISKNVDKQISKNQLRSQFQKQLFDIVQGANTNLRFKQKQDQQLNQSIGVKPIQLYNSDQYIQAKQKQIQPSFINPKKDKPDISQYSFKIKQTNDKRSLNQSFSPRRQPIYDYSSKQLFDTKYLTDGTVYQAMNKLGMTPQQYEVYLRKKRTVNKDRQYDHQKSQNKIKQKLLLKQKQQYQKAIKARQQKVDRIQQQRYKAKLVLAQENKKIQTEQLQRLRIIQQQKKLLLQQQIRIKRQWQQQKRKLKQQKQKQKQRQKKKYQEKYQRQRKKKQRYQQHLKRLSLKQKQLQDSYSQQQYHTKKKKKRRQPLSQSSDQQQDRKNYQRWKKQQRKLKKQKQYQESQHKVKQDNKETKKQNVRIQQQLKSNRQNEQQQKQKAIKYQINKLKQQQNKRRQNQQEQRQRQRQKKLQQQIQQLENKKNILKQKQKQAQEYHSKQVKEQVQKPLTPQKQIIGLQSRIRPNQSKLTISRKLSMLAVPTKILNDFDTKIQIQTIQQKKINTYIDKFYNQLPAQLLAISNHKKSQMANRIYSQLAFTYLVGKNSHGFETGLAFVHHDRTKIDNRKFIIDFLGSFNPQNFFMLFLKVADYVFRKDPCDQIQMTLSYTQGRQQQQLTIKQFGDQFQKIGNIYQKRNQQRIQRKFLMRRPFNLKCEINTSNQQKNPFNSIIKFSYNILVSDFDLSILDKTLIRETQAQDEISYALQLAQYFRHNLTPDEADQLKAKVKQSLKLKQILIMVVQFQKKKVQIQQVKCNLFKTLTQLNMRLLSNGRQTLKMIKDSHLTNNRVFHLQTLQQYKMPFDFHTSTLPFQTSDVFRQVSYFRLAPHAGFKLHTLKSAMYTQTLHVLPTQNPQFRIILINAQEFLKIRNGTDLYMYYRLFMKNVRSHSQANWRYVWVPAWSTKSVWRSRQFRSIFDKDIWTWDSNSFNYKQYMPSSLLIQPTHKDLVISAPFIMGVINTAVQQASQGSALYLRLIGQQQIIAFQQQLKH